MIQDLESEMLFEYLNEHSGSKNGERPNVWFKYILSHAYNFFQKGKNLRKNNEKALKEKLNQLILNNDTTCNNVIQLISKKRMKTTPYCEGFCDHFRLRKIR